MEIWKNIPDFSKYQASNYGNLRSLNYKRTGKTKVLKPALSGGYYKTMLQNDNGKYFSWSVHKFITLAFFGVRGKGLEVNHKNGIKTDNSIDNLEYCTRSENIKHAFRTGLDNAERVRGENNATAKLSNKDVIEIRNYVNEAKSKGIRFYGRKELALKYGVSEGHIKDIVSKRRGIWKHL